MIEGIIFLGICAFSVPRHYYNILLVGLCFTCFCSGENLRFDNQINTFLSLSNVEFSPCDIFEITKLSPVDRVSLKCEEFINSCDLSWISCIDGKIVGIVLIGHEPLLSSIRDEICHFRNLKYIDLSYNGLRGTIPPCLSSLKHIEYINLAGNCLTGTIPGKLGQLSNLITLHLDHNLLSDPIQHEVLNLSQLRRIRVDENKWLKRMRRLEDVGLVTQNKALCDFTQSTNIGKIFPEWKCNQNNTRPIIDPCLWYGI